MVKGCNKDYSSSSSSHESGGLNGVCGGYGSKGKGLVIVLLYLFVCFKLYLGLSK
jgi:hypothetical protein